MAQQAIKDVSDARTWYDRDDDHSPGSDGVSTDEGVGGSTVTLANGDTVDYLSCGRTAYGGSELGTPK